MRLRRAALSKKRFAAAWAATEVLRSDWPLGGMPWGRLGFAVVEFGHDLFGEHFEA